MVVGSCRLQGLRHLCCGCLGAVGAVLQSLWAAILTQPFWGSYPSLSFATVSDEQLDRELRKRLVGTGEAREDGVLLPKVSAARRAVHHGEPARKLVARASRACSRLLRGVYDGWSWAERLSPCEEAAASAAFGMLQNGATASKTLVDAVEATASLQFTNSCTDSSSWRAHGCCHCSSQQTPPQCVSSCSGSSARA